MAGYEIVSTEREPQIDLIKHDYGTYRDGPCLGCEALEQGGESITCPDCGGSGDPQYEGHIACMGCGGNHRVVKVSTL